MNRRARNLLHAGLRGLGLLPWLRRLGQGPLVFFYHGVEDGGSDSPLSSAHLPLPQFQRQVDFLRSHFQVISLDELYQGLTGRARLGPEQVVITLDDGLANQATVAGPLLHAWGLPFAVFINTKSVEEGQRLPTYYLRALLEQPDLRELDLPSLGLKLPAKLPEQRQAIRQCLGGVLKSAPQAVVRRLVEEMQAALGPGRWEEIAAGLPSFAPLTWEQVKALAGMGATIGSHCHEHALLHRAQPQAEVRFQLSRSQELIAAHLGQCLYLCYPNGRLADACPQARRLAAALGYRLGLTTMAGEVRRGQDPLLLPRVVAPWEEDDSMRELEIMVSRRLGINRAYQAALAAEEA